MEPTTDNSKEEKNLLLQMKSEISMLRNELKMHKASVNKFKRDLNAPYKRPPSREPFSHRVNPYDNDGFHPNDTKPPKFSEPVRPVRPVRPRSPSPPPPPPPPRHYYDDYHYQQPLFPPAPPPLPPLPPAPYQHSTYYNPHMYREEMLMPKPQKIVIGNKTELCTEHKHSENIQCGFAHMIIELQPCKYGYQCTYGECRSLLHSESDKDRLMDKTKFLIPRLCKYYMNEGRCEFGFRCKYIHWSSRYGVMNSK